MNKHFPWDIIPLPQTELIMIRVDDTHPHDYSWGRNSNGNELLILPLPGLDEKNIWHRKLELSGIQTEICKLPDSGQLYFQLTLLTSASTDIFYILCKDVIEKTRKIPNLSEALNLVYQRLERWRAFLSKPGSKILSPQEVQGLFAELSFLEECIDKGSVSPQAAVEGWQGPLGAPHDFIFGHEAVEIKSVSGSFADGVRISSEGQLITHLNSLYLHVVFLMKDISENNGISLNSIVNKIRCKLSEEVLSIFEDRLFDFGYIDVFDYDRPWFSVTQTRTYGVIDGFPRLTPDNIPQGISEVSYFMNFGSIEKFLINDFKLRNKL